LRRRASPPRIGVRDERPHLHAAQHGGGQRLFDLVTIEPKMKMSIVFVALLIA
jgi:hypothetical protein